MKNLLKNLVKISSFFYLFLSVTLVASASELSIVPNQNFVSVGENFTVDLQLTATTSAINAVEAALSFDQNYLRVDSLDQKESALLLWALEPQYDNQTGSLSFAGGVTGDGLKASKLNLLRITFIVLKAGTTTLAFTNNASVLIADGLGTADQIIAQPLTVHLQPKASRTQLFTEVQTPISMILFFCGLSILFFIHRRHVGPRLSKKSRYYYASVMLVVVLVSFVMWQSLYFTKSSQEATVSSAKR